MRRRAINNEICRLITVLNGVRKPTSLLFVRKFEKVQNRCSGALLTGVPRNNKQEEGLSVFPDLHNFVLFSSGESQFS